MQQRPRASIASATNVPTIVVIDDDPLCVRLCKMILDIAGYRVVPCAPQPAARARVAHLQPAAIVLDLHMPELDGIQFFRELRADPMTRSIPVVFTTSNPEEIQQRLPDYASQRAWLVAKPYAPILLQTTVAAMLPPIARER